VNEIIVAIADFIEDWAQAQASPIRVKNWGFAEIAKRTSRGRKLGQDQGKGEQPIPMTINGTGEREQISLDDEFDWIHWIRVPGRAQIVSSPEDTWGIKEGKQQNLGLRIVIAHGVTLGENLVNNLVNELPESLIIAGMEYVWINPGSVIDYDHETIYNTELGVTVYEKHRFDWNIYVIELNVQFLPCVDYTPQAVPDDALTDSDGNYITAS
jgi:hypothetical protein